MGRQNQPASIFPLVVLIAIIVVVATAAFSPGTFISGKLYTRPTTFSGDTPTGGYGGPAGGGSPGFGGGIGGGLQTSATLLPGYVLANGINYVTNPPSTFLLACPTTYLYNGALVSVPTPACPVSQFPQGSCPTTNPVTLASLTGVCDTLTCTCV